jgi:hypothetical protein
VFFCLHITEYEQIRRGGGTFSWAQGGKIPKYGPGHSQSYDSMCALYIRCALSTGKYGNSNITGLTGMSYHIWYLKYVGFFLHCLTPLIVGLTGCSEMSVTNSNLHHVTSQKNDDHIRNIHFNSFIFCLFIYRYNLRMRK